MSQNFDIHHWLDITNEVCPMSFVKTKLTLEKMKTGDILAVRLKDGDALKNVPKSVEEQGHTILSLGRESENNEYYELLIKKGA